MNRGPCKCPYEPLRPLFHLYFTLLYAIIPELMGIKLIKSKSNQKILSQIVAFNYCQHLKKVAPVINLQLLKKTLLNQTISIFYYSPVCRWCFNPDPTQQICCISHCPSTSSDWMGAREIIFLMWLWPSIILLVAGRSVGSSEVIRDSRNSSNFLSSSVDFQ